MWQSTLVVFPVFCGVWAVFPIGATYGNSGVQKGMVHLCMNGRHFYGFLSTSDVHSELLILHWDLLEFWPSACTATVAATSDPGATGIGGTCLLGITCHIGVHKEYGVA